MHPGLVDWLLQQMLRPIYAIKQLFLKKKKLVENYLIFFSTEIDFADLPGLLGF